MYIQNTLTLTIALKTKIKSRGNIMDENKKKQSSKEFKLINVPTWLYKVLILLTIVVIIIIFLSLILMAKRLHTEKEQNTPPDSGSQFEQKVEEYRDQQQSIYQDSIDDLKDNTVYHTDGTVTYFDSYMDSDYPDMTLDKYIEYSYDNGDVLQCDFEGSNLYVLLVYALKQVNINNSFSDVYTCISDSDVHDIKTALIFQCTAHGSNGHTVTATVDCSNIKVRIDSVEVE